MKFRYAIIAAFAGMLLTACNFTLASDITPPPNYVAPTPMPTLGPLYPSNPPSIENGAKIYEAKCAACHGDTGKGNGPQSFQLPVTVPGIGLPELGQVASPAQWFKVVSLGNMDRLMPMFTSLSEQERWDVVAYVMTLHTTPEQIAQGKVLFEKNCAGCAGKFTNQEKLAGLSEADLVRLIRNGEGDIPAFAKDFTDDEAFAAAAYIRTLTFALATPPTSTPIAAAVSTESAAAVSGTPEAATASPSAMEATPMSGMGSVRGTIEIASGNLPGNLSVTLRGYEQAPDQTQTPKEVLTLTSSAGPDGAYQFENVEMPANRIFFTEVDYAGITFRSGFGTAKADDKQMVLPPVKLYETSMDVSLLTFQQLHLYADFDTGGTAQFFEIYNFSNDSDKAVIISTDGTNIPFIQLPASAQNTGYQPGQDTAPFVPADDGVAVVPGDASYSIIAFFSLPYNMKLEFAQPFGVDIPAVIILFPEGIKANGRQLTDRGIQSIQNAAYQQYSSDALKAGDTLTFAISGQAKIGSSSAAAPNTTQSILIGAGVLGLTLIGAGAWFYFRDRNAKEDDEDENEFDSADEVMDAMLALDDLHRAGKISDEAYQTRRDELKEILKEMA